MISSQKRQVNGLGKQGKAVQGKFSAAFKGAAAFGPGDAVVWKSSDEDLPAGTQSHTLRKRTRAFA